MKNTEKIFSFLSLILFFLVWEGLVIFNHYPSFILPQPTQIFFRLIKALQDGTLIFNTIITLKEIFLGLVLGFSLAFILGYFIAKLNFVKIFFTPLIVGFQAIPMLALAPLLIIWFGTGIWSKIIVCAATLFFPVLINTIVGFNNIDKNLNELVNSMGANFWQKLIILEIPSSLPILFGGLKIGTTLSVIGAVVGEFVGADKGLGYLINLAGGLYDTPLRFVAFMTLSIIAFSLYYSVSFIEKRLIKWR